MGDRANIKIIDNDNDNPIYLYTQWAGSLLPGMLHEALSMQERWDDPAYLTRIIFSRMIKNSVTGTTGFGISTVPGDGLDRVITVNMMRRSIRVNNSRECSFDEYVAAEGSIGWGADEEE